MNPYCDILDIEVPSLAAVKDHTEANTYALLIVALLEEGGPLTLEEVAGRFERAGVTTRTHPLLSLKRCKPARAPVYRDGDHYALDPHDDTELDLWLFRLGLRPPRVPRLEVVRPTPEPLPGPETPLSAEEVEEAFRGEHLSAPWSAQRLAIAILEAYGSPMPATKVIARLTRLTPHHRLRRDSDRYWRRGAPVSSTEDGLWTLTSDHPAVESARIALRKKLEVTRRWASDRPDPARLAVLRRRREEAEAAKEAELARLRRVLMYAFPAKAPGAVTFVDVEERTLTTLMGEELERVAEVLRPFDVIGAIGVRPLLRALDFHPEARRLSELGPPQKTLTLNRRGRTLRITPDLLVRSSCGISRPFADPATLDGYLRKGQSSRLRRRLEADAKSLFALYQYGRLHGVVRVTWGFLDDRIVAPWSRGTATRLFALKREAFRRGLPLEVVVGHAPGWAEPWSRARRWTVVRSPSGFGHTLLDESGTVIDSWQELEIQAARVGGGAGPR